MIASQVDTAINNDGLIIVPTISCQIAAQFSEEPEDSLYGIISIHNDLGSSKSIMLPAYREAHSERLTINHLNTKSEPSEKSNAPDWFLNACLASEINSPKNVKASMQTVVANMGAEIPIHRDIQLNILVPEDEKFLKKHPTDLLPYLQLEILSGEVGTDLATYRRVYNGDEFDENGHFLEAILSCTLMPAWQTKEFDLPYSICREARWLGAQYLSKNTRGNLIPQLTPIVESHFKKIIDSRMSSMNEHWGALGFLSSLKRD